ncbi:unnamed protein product [Tuber melanosporum]|uniref:(Perigord truffle) hypothetical protein n=1 Tax=Tuber melanosporum (strain Mel28) TaxID=656061 RepID=D5GHD7_TUBMM|nr:uncharacterized protein GSTUM_00007815001 [Tuber melanosporum]CAZ83930.1 unnamed protein product [Tuber melanosporum]
MPSIEDLPFEILSDILSIAAQLNSTDTPSYTYGLTQAQRTLQRTQTQIYLRGRTTPDVLRWHLVNSFRLVNSRWHEWALGYAMREIYVRKWRGGERWLYKSTEEQTRSSAAAGVFPVVYQHPYSSVKSTISLLRDYPHIAQHVRRVWFNGIYHFDTSRYIFDILGNCTGLHTAAIPWTSLRYGTEEDWKNLMSFPQLTSIEFLAVDLEDSLVSAEVNRTDNNILLSLDFSRITRLKIFGDSNLLPITDDDLITISRTATSLQEIHITSSTSITIKGLAALVSASRTSLKLLEYKPLSDSGFTHPSSVESHPQIHICTLLSSCPKLEDLAITLPTACPELFSRHSVAWHETVRLRIAGSGVCRFSTVDENIAEFSKLLEGARELLGVKRDLGVEISVGKFLFDTKTRLVHGNYKSAKVVSEMGWGPVEHVSLKGPYGATGLYGDDDVKGEWSAISEEEFWEGMRWGFVKFDS